MFTVGIPTSSVQLCVSPATAMDEPTQMYVEYPEGSAYESDVPLKRSSALPLTVYGMVGNIVEVDDDVVVEVWDGGLNTYIAPAKLSVPKPESNAEIVYSPEFWEGHTAIIEVVVDSLVAPEGVTVHPAGN